MADLNHPFLKNRVVILNGFSDAEIFTIMRTVKALCADGGTKNAQEEPGIACQKADLVFARTTPRSLQTTLSDLIIDMSSDHEYLKKNPPGSITKPQGE